MTVAELIVHLSTLDQSLPVMVRSYEFGYKYAEPANVYESDVALNYHGTEPSYGGPHETIIKDEDWHDYGAHAQQRALILDRGVSSNHD